MMTEAEVGYELQDKNTKDFRPPPEAKRGGGGVLPRASEGHMAC